MSLPATPQPVVIGAVFDRVMIVASVGGVGFSVSLPVAEAERALGQLAVAIVKAKGLPADGGWLDRREGPAGPGASRHPSTT